jgi:aminomethyltransferase
MEQVKDSSKVTKRRIGLTAREGPPPRGHMEIQNASGETIGEVTSGCPSPSLAPLNVAMGYITGDHYKTGTKLNIKVRNKLVPAEVVKMPFLKGKYYVQPKK